MNDDALIEALVDAEDANMFARDCQVCTALDQMSEGARNNVKRALTGTIGEKKLAAILTKNGYPTGRRAIGRHRLEGHAS